MFNLYIVSVLVLELTIFAWYYVNDNSLKNTE